MVVIAILGILGAITVPVVTSYVGSAKERAYEADLQKIQVAVSAYYSSPSNVRFAGKRQYPNFGWVNQGTANALLKANASSTELTTVGTGLSSNPVGGTQGGTPTWEDIDGDGVRDRRGREALLPRSDDNAVGRPLEHHGGYARQPGLGHVPSSGVRVRHRVAVV